MISLDPDKLSCGCDFADNCHCELQPFTTTRAELQRLTKVQLYLVYIRCLNDEMSPVMWRGLTKPEILIMILGDDSRRRGATIELIPFI